MKYSKNIMRSLLFILVLCSFLKINGQELNALVIVNSEQIQNSNKQLYDNLQASISEYLNNTKWTDKSYKPQERVSCAITLTILEQPSSNEFKGNISIVASRPVYNSTYQTPIFNYRDNNLTFNYTEFQNLIYNENSFESNLVSILTFYVYTVLGIDADTFELNGGEEYHKKAEKVVNLAQQGGFSGWNRIDGNNTRYQLNENLLSPTYKAYRTAMYNYHLNGLDMMNDDKKKAKTNISDAVLTLNTIYNTRPNAFLLRVFMDTKSDEIADIFSGGPRINAVKLKETLLKIYPTYSDKWDKIKI
ncbi:type IX secretion system protein PorD [Aureibaculum conchae]|uniref:type IX secretion system protein PorD n=1 Tax=Aureibaculum sp. 2308TA14-22 TaxID=3108392 RepID=UPI0033970DC0